MSRAIEINLSSLDFGLLPQPLDLVFYHRSVPVLWKPLFFFQLVQLFQNGLRPHSLQQILDLAKDVDMILLPVKDDISQYIDDIDVCLAGGMGSIKVFSSPLITRPETHLSTYRISQQILLNVELLPYWLVSHESLARISLLICMPFTDLQFLSFVYHAFLDRPLDRDGYSTKYIDTTKSSDWRLETCMQILSCSEFTDKRREIDAMSFLASLISQSSI